MLSITVDVEILQRSPSSSWHGDNSPGKMLLQMLKSGAITPPTNKVVAPCLCVCVCTLSVCLSAVTHSSPLCLTCM